MIIKVCARPIPRGTSRSTRSSCMCLNKRPLRTQVLGAQWKLEQAIKKVRCKQQEAADFEVDRNNLSSDERCTFLGRTPI